MAPPGTSLEESDRLAIGVESRILEIPGVDHVVRRTGRAERDEHAEPPSNSEIEVRMHADADAKAVLTQIDRILKNDIPGIETNIGQPISHRLSHVLSGTKAQIAVDIFGDDLNVLRKLAQQVKNKLSSIPGTRDVNANREVLIQTLPINFRPQDLARYGLQAADAGRQVRRAMFGEQISVVHQGHPTI